MKVLLISANTLKEPYPVYPLGLDYVAGTISDQHEVQIADMNLLKEYEPLCDILGRFSPDIIGISLRNVDNTDTTDPRGFIENYRELIDVVRSRSKGLIVLGGSGFTMFPGEIMDTLDVDYGILGEGERLSLLIEALEKGEETATIPGVITRQIRKPIPAPWHKVISRNFHADHLHLGFYLKNGGMLNLQTKRGCCFKCIYCTYPYIEGPNHRVLTQEEIVDTALRLQAAGAKYIFITDSAFNSDQFHSIMVAKALKKAGVTVPWGAFFMPVKPPEGYYRIMAEAGMTHAEFGTESLSNQVLTSYRKPFRVEHVFEAHQAALDAGLHVAHYFLLGGPGEDSNTLNETLSNIDKLKKTVSFFFCGMRIYPHTALHDLAVKEGQISKSLNILEPVFYHSPSIQADEIIRRVRDKATNRSNWIIGSGGPETASILSRLYKRGHTGPLWEYLVR